MKLSAFCVHRPVFTTVLSLLLIIVGFISFERLALRDLPDVSVPVVSVNTSYPGAAADLVESQVTTLIEDSIASINGIDSIRSTSRYGSSQILVQFDPTIDLGDAINEIRDKISALRMNLPDDINPPSINKASSNDMQVLILSFSDPNRTRLQLRDFINRYIIPQVRQIDGVGSVGTWGPSYAMRVWLDPVKMAGLNVSVDDLVARISDQNRDAASGQVKADTRSYSLLVNSRMNTIEQFEQLIIRQDAAGVVRLGDVSWIEVAESSDESTETRINRQPSVGMRIVAQSTANPLKVGQEVLELIEQISETLPPGMTYDTAYDVTSYIEESINEVYKTLAEAFVLVLLVVFLFLGSMRSASIPIVTIPICLIAVFFPIYLMGYTINTITLLALVLAIGLVVDDAIVMLENIHRHVELGEKPFAAALIGSREIGFAIIAMTITLAAVYAPIAFMAGLTGDLFKEFAFALAVAVLISGFVSLTLTPMMCARMLHDESHETRFTRWLDVKFSELIQGYKKTLHSMLLKKHLILVLTLILGMSGYLMFLTMPAELAPLEDTGYISTAAVPPTNTNFAYVSKYAEEVEDILLTVPEQESVFFIVNGGGAPSWLRLSHWDDRKRSQQDIMADIAPKLAEIPGLTVTPTNTAMFRGTSSTAADTQISLIVMSSDSYLEINEMMQAILARINDNSGLVNVNNTLRFDNQNFRLTINRQLATDMGVTQASITNALRNMVNGYNVAKFEYAGSRYNVKLHSELDNRRDLTILDKLHVQTKNGSQVPLSTIIDVVDEVSPINLPHYNRLRSAEITANLAPGYTMSDAISFLEQIVDEILPVNYQYSFEGQAKQFLESSGSMAFAFIMALVFIYLVLAAQFESFVDPFIILFSVPLAIVGSLLALKLAGVTLNIYSNIGLVTLIGLITKHGILITEFANQLREQGKDIAEAIETAAALRLRPILMTTAAMVLAALPLAYASGAGAASRQSIGLVIVGGLLIGSFFSLFVVPAAYMYLGKYTKRAS